MPTFRIKEAADLLGVSNDTFYRWIDAGRITAADDASGVLAVDGAALARLAQELAEPADHGESSMVVAHSVRNRFSGLITVGSDQGAVPGFHPARFPGPPSEPAVPVSGQPALHKSRWVGVFSRSAGPWRRDCRSPVAVARGAHLGRVVDLCFAIAWPPSALAVTAADGLPGRQAPVAVFAA